MDILKSIREECIKIGSSAKKKGEVLEEIARLAHRCPALAGISERLLFEKLSAREKVGTTGFGNGIAIPHCTLENIEGFVLGLLVIPQGVDFDSMDKKKTKIFFFIIAPKERRNEHIQVLSSVSKLLKSAETVQRILSANEPKEIVDHLSTFWLKREEIMAKKLQTLFIIFVQREECFDDILQALLAAVEGSIAVIETNNAGYYLHKLPLFASFWSERTRIFSRIIMAVVDKDLSNDVIRRINMVCENIDKEPGVLVTVQDLLYSVGSIEF
jgi:mannitol/fructose-specific phosphotransferase system IIA component (Ntr-type)